MSTFLDAAPPPPTPLGEYRVLSPTAGVRVSPLQLGGMSLGQAWTGMMGGMSKEEAFKLLDAFWEAGGNFIDTANNYQNEESEAWIGEWAEARGLRDQLVIATKFTSDYHSHAVGKGKGPNYCGNHRKSLHMSVRDSLRKLRTDYVDILYIHWWDYTTSVRELMDGLHHLVQQGKVLYLGASDLPAWVVSAANTYAVESGKTPFSMYQGRWNVMTRDFEREIVPMARAFGMALCPWDVLGGGRFQTPAALEERRARGEGIRNIGGAADKRVQTEEEARVSEALLKVAREHGSESVTAVALAYVRSKAQNVFPIVGGRRIEHLRDNIAALSIRLTDEQIAYLEAVKPFDLGFPADFLGPDPNVTGHSARLLRTSPIAFPNAQKPNA